MPSSMPKLSDTGGSSHFKLLFPCAIDITINTLPKKRQTDWQSVRRGLICSYACPITAKTATKQPAWPAASLVLVDMDPAASPARGLCYSSDSRVLAEIHSPAGRDT
jgi:hypothetical protein